MKSHPHTACWMKQSNLEMLIPQCKSCMTWKFGGKLVQQLWTGNRLAQGIHSDKAESLDYTLFSVDSITIECRIRHNWVAHLPRSTPVAIALQKNQNDQMSSWKAADSISEFSFYLTKQTKSTKSIQYTIYIPSALWPRQGFPFSIPDILWIGWMPEALCRDILDKDWYYR